MIEHSLNTMTKYELTTGENSFQKRKKMYTMIDYSSDTSAFDVD